MIWGHPIILLSREGKDKGRILNIKYSAGNWRWHYKGQEKKVKGKRRKGKGRWTREDGQRMTQVRGCKSGVKA